MKTLASFALLVGVSAWAAQPRPVQLLSAATVERESIYLSDLLVPDTRGPLRVATEEIPLGRSPQPGSLRAFTREQLLHLIGGRVEVEVPEQVVVRRPLQESQRKQLAGKSPPYENRVGRGTHEVAPPLIRPRVPALLAVETDAVRIQLRVLPLRAGALGETVRVLDPATRRVLVAQVAGEGLLKLCDQQAAGEGTHR